MSRTPHSDPAPRYVFSWVVIGSSGFWLVHFLAGVLLLVGSTGDFTNAHGTEAREHYLGFIVLNHLKLLKAYALASIGYALLIYPVVWAWMRFRKAPKKPFSVLWRTTTIATLLIVHSGISLALTRPYFYSVALTSWARQPVDSLPPFIRTAWVWMIPILFVSTVCIFYTDLVIRRFSRSGSAPPKLRTSIITFASIAAVLSITSGRFSQADVSTAPLAKPNILILASDSLRADRLSCNGYERNTTPTIDSLAARSVNFQKCFTPVGSTLESLITMMTGQYPHTHGVQHMYPNKAQIDTVNVRSPTLADALEKAGYETAVWGDWCAGIFNVVPLGFDQVSVSDYDNFKIYISQAICVHHLVLGLYFDNPVGYKLFPELEAFAQYVTPETVTNRVIDQIESRTASTNPFFYTVFYSSTHLPYHTGEPYCDLFTNPDYDGRNQYKMHFDVDGFIAGRDMDETWQAMRDREVAQIKGLYDGCVRQFDDNVGRILESLKATGQLDNTIILVTSDHGDDQMEPNTTFGHGLSFNGGDQSNHIPFVLHIPGTTTGKKIDSIVRTLDFAPTLLDLVGETPLPSMEGMSLRATIENPDEDPSIAFYGETAYLFVKRKIPGEDPLHLPPMDRTTFVDPDFDYHFVLKEKYQQAVLDTKEHALRTQRYKLVRTPGLKAPIFRLYDLREDPHCETDIGKSNNHILAPMKAALLRWVHDHKDTRINEIFPDGEPEPVAHAKAA